jgi:hypothetical protein
MEREISLPSLAGSEEGWIGIYPKEFTALKCESVSFHSLRNLKELLHGWKCVLKKAQNIFFSRVKRIFLKNPNLSQA